MNLDPEQVLNIFAKNVDTSFAGAIPNSLLARQDLESEIVKLTNRNTPLRDMVKRTRGEGRAHLWNQRVALGHLPGNNSPLEIFYKDGALPTQSDPQYLQKTAAYAYLGVTGVAYSIAPVKSGCIGETPSNVGNTEATWETRESVETNTPDSSRIENQSHKLYNIDAMITLVCALCQKNFTETRPSHVKKRRFCSRSCNYEHQRGLAPWNKGLTVESTQSIREGVAKSTATIRRQFEEGRAKPKGMTGCRHTAEWKEKMSRRNAGKNNPFYGRRHSAATRAIIRAKTIECEILKSRRYSYTKPEKAFYQELDRQGIIYTPQYDLDGKFVVDAYVPDMHTLVQIDGDYWHNLPRVEKKDRSFNSYATKHGYRLVRFWEHEVYQALPACISRLLKIESDTPSDRSNTQNYRPDDKPKAVIVKSRYFGGTPQSRAIPSQPASAESA